jgi:hypothetical protein
MRIVIGLICGVALLACHPAAGPQANVVAASTASPAGLSAALSMMRVSGTVVLPTSLISDAAGNVISNNAGGLISDAGASIIGNHGGGYRLLKLDEKPASRVRIALTDAEGKPYRWIPPFFTDVQGRFVFAQVPDGITYRVVATIVHEGREIKFSALTAGGRDVNVDLASTLVTAQLLLGRTGDLTKIPEEQFTKAVAAVAAVLDEKTVKAVLDTKSDKELVAELNRVVDAVPQAAAVVQDVVRVLTKVLEIPVTELPILDTTPPPTTAQNAVSATPFSATTPSEGPTEALSAPSPEATTVTGIEQGTSPVSGTDNGQTIVELLQSDLDAALGIASPSPTPTPIPSASGLSVDGGLGITNGQLINPAATPGISL